MPRDYSRNRNNRSSDRRDYKQGSSQSASGITWLLIGILVGLCIAGVAYLNQSKNHNDNAQNNNNTQLAANPANHNSTNASKKSNVNSPQFDFYNTLSSDQDNSAPTTAANNTNTTTDGAAPNSSPPNPAKVNAILSGVTPPSANATNAGENQNNNTAQLNNANQNSSTNQTNNAIQNSSANQANNNQNNVNSKSNAQPLSANSVDDNGEVMSTPKNATKTNVENSTTTNNNATNSQSDSNSQSALPYVIQLAAFMHHQQADQFKAQLAFYGYEAKIVSFQRDGKTLQRVWLGPYPSLTAAAAVQRQLAENKIKSTLIRSDMQ